MTSGTLLSPVPSGVFPGKVAGSAGDFFPPAWTLRSLGTAYRGRLLCTYGLLNLENLVHLAQPWVLGLAINDLMAASYLGLVLFAVQYLAYVALGAWRRSYDARAFTGIYADLASSVVLRQRRQGIEVSQVVTRSALSREVVDFFERDIPVVFQALYSVIGALVMLAVCDVVLVPCCLALLVPVGCFSVWGGRKSLTLNSGLNDELEREVDVIRHSRHAEVNGHYRAVAGWRVRLADWQALNFAGTELFVLGLLAAALFRSCTAGSPDLGRVFAVFGYVLLFVGSLANVPQLAQQASRLRDINRRIGTDGLTGR